MLDLQLLKITTAKLCSQEKKIPIYSRAEMLADVVSKKKNIVITGSHGKTTTTSLISKILSDQKLDPTIINGGVINSLNSNAKLGKGDWAILEADESDGSFLNYQLITQLLPILTTNILIIIRILKI